MATNGLRVLLLADDLTGAADAGIAFAHRGLATGVLLNRLPAVGAGQVVALDLDTRDRQAGDVGEIVRLAGTQQAEVTLLKLDSMLRGHVREALEGMLLARPEALLVVAPALPAMGRTTVDGAQLVDGQPTGRRLLDLLEGMPTTLLHLPAVRGDLTAALARITTPIVVLDAETDQDLAGAASAARQSRRAVTWAGTAGLATAVAASMGAPRHGLPPGPAVIGPGSSVTVIGSATSAARAQADSLAAAGATPISVPARELLSAPHPALAALRRRIADAASRADVVVSLQEPHLSGSDHELIDRLAVVVADAVGLASLLVLTGGATARAVLTSHQVERLDLRAEVEPGVVLSQAPGGDLHVITKSGSFGDAHTLTRSVQSVRRGAQT